MIYGEAGVGKSALASWLASSRCTESSLYISTEDELSFFHISCPKTKTSVIMDYRTLLLVLLENLDVDVLVIDSLSSITRYLPPEIGSKVSALVSWLMHRRGEKGKLSVTVAQVSAKSGRTPYHEFIEPWADYVVRVKRLREGKRMAIMECPREEIRCFTIGRGEISWVSC
ncbi:hypothetical protein IPA_06055 [Ignicoccus pacificus DSM 13166]|uniref:Uncharacterized protein n=1 Tax=Ignicoccus pacificus DSM 13166 TaxID=940294 RepID=A0A977KBF6_9CREN|nr:hypothetical protein IPA_06055 [Ignicoccus pacificus DSM 13166]